MQNKPTLYYRFYKLLKFLYQAVDNFEKQYKYSLGEETLKLAWQCLDLVIKTNALPNNKKKASIEKLSVTFDKLKVRLRMAQELKQLSKGQWSDLQQNHIKQTGEEINKWLNWSMNTENRKQSNSKQNKNMKNNQNKINHFTDLDAWQKNYKLTRKVYEITKDFPEEEKFGLTSQLRRAAASITANIAEGYGRYHYKDKNKFYYQARGSNTEVQNHLILAKDLGYLTEEQYQQLKQITFEGYKLLSGLIKSTKDS